MLAADIPTTKFPVPFANGASGTYKTVPIPTASAGASRASLADGFPTNTFLAIGAGGVPPDGRDFNGILFEITGWQRWQQAGGPIVYDAAFSTAIGGYPAGAVLSTNPAGGLWLSTADNNTTNPDASGAGWVPLMPIKASIAECRAGTNDTDFVTPLGMADKFAQLPATASMLQNGYYELPGGLIMQWGRFDIGPGPTTLTVGFPLSFPTACFSCIAGGSGNPPANQTNNIDVIGGTIGTSGFIATSQINTVLHGCFIAYGI